MSAMAESDQKLPEEPKGEEKKEEEDEELMDKDSWREALCDMLDSVDHKGDFAVTKPVSFPSMHPMLTVEGMNERIAFPLLEVQAKELRGTAEKAPYGKGSSTILDESVRKAWQIDASKVTFQEEEDWKLALADITADTIASLGLSSSQQSRVEANLYKMLLYETGGHFQKHRDTEKETGMFGTLIIHLPCTYTGGSLVLQHQGETKTVDLAPKAAKGFFATAFYADCEHQLLPVKSGWRLCLVYNLVMRQSAAEALPTAQELTAQLRTLRKLEKQWPQVSSENIQGYLLEHKYTTTNLKFSNLKGRDKEMAEVLRQATDAAGKPLFVTSLALLEKWETGSAESSYGYGGRYYDDDDDYHSSGGGHHTMEEVHDSSVKFTHWVGPNDRAINNCSLAPNPDESLFLNLEDSIEGEFGEDPDKEDYEGYMGNYGPTLEYWYYKSALMFWPRSLNPRVAASGGISFMCASLLTAPQDEAKEYAMAAAQQLERDHSSKVTPELLEGMLRAGDLGLVERVLTRTSPLDGRELGKALVTVVHGMPLTAGAVMGVVQRTCNSNKYYSPIGVSEFQQMLELFDRKDLAASVRRYAVEGSIEKWKMLLSRQEDISAVVGMAYRCPDLLESFVTTALQHASPSQLRTCVALLMSKEGAAQNTQVRRLYQKRAEQLHEATRYGKPAFTWRQPHANFPGSHASAVNSFLRGNEQTRTFHDFNGIGHARNWANKYFGGYGQGSGYSARAMPGGRGQNAFVEVIKTKSNHTAQLHQYDEDVKELKRLSNFFSIPLGNVVVSDSKRSASINADSVASAPKKSRSEGDKENPIQIG